MNYSVVLPVYACDDPNWLILSIESILRQTIASNDIIIATDGPLTPLLAQTIQGYSERHPEISVLIEPTNQGAGPTRNRAIAATKHPLVAVQDADDISATNRMELSLAALNADPELVMVGGQIAEFTNDDPEQLISFRRVPLKVEQVRDYSRRRMPVNGPTLMFRKAEIEALGGYGEGTRSEDYLLIARLLAAGKKIENLPQVVLWYRESAGAIARRRTWNHLRGFVGTRLEVHRLGIGNWLDVIVPCTAQLALTVTPPAVTKFLYSKVLR
ncbi:MAG: glycosyltransferase [Promicromonosporaceae bacterium]|nr:glycosyltransferase [Promicromonosporaceae bacterium]